MRACWGAEAIIETSWKENNTTRKRWEGEGTWLRGIVRLVGGTTLGLAYGLNLAEGGLAKRFCCLVAKRACGPLLCHPALCSMVGHEIRCGFRPFFAVVRALALWNESVEELLPGNHMVQNWEPRCHSLCRATLSLLWCHGCLETDVFRAVVGVRSWYRGVKLPFDFCPQNTNTAAMIRGPAEQLLM